MALNGFSFEVLDYWTPDTDPPEKQREDLMTLTGCGWRNFNPTARGL